MNTPPNISLPREEQPARDIFSREGKWKRGSFFLKIASRIGHIMEEMPDKERQGVYMDEIPMGYKVLYDMEAVHTAFGSGEGTRPDFRPEAEFWRPEEDSFVVLYEAPVAFDFNGKTDYRRSHYRDRKHKAVEDADQLAKAWGCKVAVARVEWLRDWH